MTESWRRWSACQGLDPSIFFPPSDEEADEAKSVCETCLVREECLEYALEQREHEGVWGGATERERRRIIRRRRRRALADRRSA